MNESMKEQNDLQEAIVKKAKEMYAEDQELGILLYHLEFMNQALATPGVSNHHKAVVKAMKNEISIILKTLEEIDSSAKQHQ